MTKTLWHKLCEKLTILKNQHTKNYYSGDVDKSIIYDEIEPQRAQQGHLAQSVRALGS